MGNTRAFERDDIPAVATLWQKVFHQREGPPPASLTAYFDQVFFQSPWYDPDLPSWVSEDREGNLVGFLGVLPRPLRWNGRPIRSAVATQLMVAPHAGAGIAALELIKRYFAGPQDLTWTDGANDSAAKLWTRLGGEVVPLYSQEWRRVLRPTRHAAGMLQGRKWLWPVLAAARPACWALDAALARLPLGPYRLPRPDLRGEPATAESLLACFGELAGRMPLRPDYEPESLRWLLAMLPRTTGHGALRAVTVRNGAGTALGWYLAFVRPGGDAKVLQIWAKDGAAGVVLDYLFHDMAEHGAAAVSGQMEPRLLRDLTDHHCRFACLSLGFLAHSRDKELRLALHRGDALLSRLEGEWWLRFGCGPFTDADPVPATADGNVLPVPALAAAPRPRLFRVAP